MLLDKYRCETSHTHIIFKDLKTFFVFNHSITTYTIIIVYNNIKNE